MPHKVGVILSGCGFKDGAEIHESVCTLLALDKIGCTIICMAPNIIQARVIDHLSGKEVKETRNVLVESARIARGNIKDISTVKATDLDALVMPGGFGAATNLSTFGKDGAKATVNPDVARLIKDMHAAKKPIGAICIAPGVVAACLGKTAHPLLTIGNDQDTAGNIEALGAKHENCGTREFVVDKKNKIVSTPAYMLGPSIAHVAEGIEKCVREVIALI
ncbi:MAG: isoprenoid biosynthesis glyoxalase ElbB [Planctomycetes bacterium]|nr:isoprenoid biosynthesis glyoxalase ElbB [Planctomycetota bacterium]